MLQESAACVRAPTTNYGVRNPGLMQSHNGVGTCNNEGDVQDPCPYSEILQMVRDGVEGTSSGDGLKQLLQQAPGNVNTRYYAAARLYNSGSIAATGMLDQGIATHCYSSDVANRLIGWVDAQKTCTLDGSTYPGSSPIAEPGSDFGTVKPIPEPVSSPTPSPKPRPHTPSPPPSSSAKPVVQASPKIAAAAPLTSPAAATQPASYPQASTQPNRNANTALSGTSASATNRAPGVTTQCRSYYRVQAGDVCNSVATRFNTTFAQLRTMNTGLDSVCSNLWLGYDYCVQGL
jgi:LysM repeat protein